MRLKECCYCDEKDEEIKKLKHQLQKQRDDIFKEIDKRIDEMYPCVYYKDKCKFKTGYLCSGCKQAKELKEHLKQKHKEGKTNGSTR